MKLVFVIYIFSSCFLSLSYGYYVNNGLVSFGLSLSGGTTSSRYGINNKCVFLRSNFLVESTTFTKQQQQQQGQRQQGERHVGSNLPITTARSKKDDQDIEKEVGNEGGIGSFFQAGPPMTVPDDIKQKLYDIESNTDAGKDRQTRTLIFIILALGGLFLTIGNTALSTIAEENGNMFPTDLEWVTNIPLLTTKWGGIFDIIIAGIFGTLVELEYKTRDENIERIWQEMNKKRSEVETKKSSIRNMPVSTSKSGKTKKKSAKQRKRLAALAEVVLEEQEDTQKLDMSVKDTTADTTTITNESSTKAEETEGEGGGIFGAAKRFYKQADDMAAAQALLLNKKLEDEGILEKITDDSGLRVIGKKDVAAEAAKEMNDKPSEETKTD